MPDPDPEPRWTDELTLEEYEQAWYLWRARQRDACLNTEETAVVTDGIRARFHARASGLSPAKPPIPATSPQVRALRFLG
ncbi:hypothetical protein [Streptomyces antarcticus]|uniref:hypothetical protein n=1 Tax=Streptomyces antarcticus TaxID=2996458 RepID=UPI00226E0774|nr:MULTISPECIES: hypothetical protein [unclassified Streptomyces]MCY0943547.1 hypothetical protein [Streptomyces sp. H34-AA3]MCZ4083544.1 hypothetical protein [Streptomyces sp. H34-S5]